MFESLANLTADAAQPFEARGEFSTAYLEVWEAVRAYQASKRRRINGKQACKALGFHIWRYDVAKRHIATDEEAFGDEGFPDEDLFTEDGDWRGGDGTRRL